VTDPNVPPDRQPVSAPTVWTPRPSWIKVFRRHARQLVGERAAGGITLASPASWGAGALRLCSAVKGRARHVIAAVDAAGVRAAGQASPTPRSRRRWTRSGASFHRRAVHGTCGPVTVQIARTRRRRPGLQVDHGDGVLLRRRGDGGAAPRSALGGLAYSREPDDPTPVSRRPASPAHSGGDDRGGLDRTRPRPAPGHASTAASRSMTRPHVRTPGKTRSSITT
jgi:hypothetical protein